MTIQEKQTGEEKIIRTTCSSHCGGICVLRVHVKDGVITRIETDDTDDYKEPQLRACLRGRSYRQRVYDPDRLRFPMKRTGERGKGEFKQISWDEALDTIAAEAKRIRTTYGPGNVLVLHGGGDIMSVNSSGFLQDLFAMTGGFQKRWGVHSFEGGLFASLATYGTLCSRSDFNDLLNSRLIILWGCDPTTTIHETNTPWYLQKAKESGTRIISVDPRYTNGTALWANEWIPIIPGTDAAMLIAMAYVMIKDNLQNQTFLDTYTIGFDKFKDYVLGIEDGVPKSPTWAEGITGVQAGVIENLAREYATIKPAALIAGIGPGRSAYGEQYHRAAKVLAAMTGNIGIHGGWAGRSSQPYGAVFGGFDFKMGSLPRSKGNPFEAVFPLRKDGLPTLKGADNSGEIHFAEVGDAILKGKDGGYPSDIRMALIMHTNLINQFPNTNKLVKALKKLEFVAVAEQVMTPTAKFADILLPVSTYMERNDITTGGATPYYGFVNKVIEPLYESKSPFEILCRLAERLGVRAYSEKTEEEWLKEIVKGSYIPDYDDFKKKGIYRLKFPEPQVGFKQFIEDPNGHPLATPSGKIEIYSQRLADMNDPKIPSIPKYIESWESRNDPLAKKYPLQLITTRFKRRAHTQFERVPWLRELLPQAISMNYMDAKARGISDGDKVGVFNDRGEMIIPVIVTKRIMPGVVDLPQGAWYDPDERGVDRGGCANVLTRDVRSPGGAACHMTSLVQVEKA